MATSIIEHKRLTWSRSELFDSKRMDDQAQLPEILRAVADFAQEKGPDFTYWVTVNNDADYGYSAIVTVEG